MIHGKDIIIYEGDENPVAIAASKSCTIDKVAGTIETSSPASGTARSYASGRTDWVATLNNLVLSVKDYMLRVGETYYLTIGVRGSSTDTISGYAICTECNVTGTVGNLAQGSFRFQGSDREGTIPPQPGETGYDMTEDQVTAIVYNVVGDGYLSRLHNDTAQGLITFNAGAYIPSGQYLRIGDAYLTYDAEYGMLKVWDGSGVVERGLYATGSVSALGAASGGGGGGGGGGDMDRDSMFAILSGAPAQASEWINAKFLKLGPGLAASNDGTLTITGAVTSVGLTMPAGFTVSGSPITSSGVIAVSLASGYKLLQSSTATPGTYTKVTVDTYGRVTAGTTLSASDIPYLPASKIPDIDGIDGFSAHVYDATVNRTANTVLAGPTSGSASPATFRALVAADIPTNISITGNAATATKATQDGAGNVITSKYVTLDTTQTITGSKTFSSTIKLSGAGIEDVSGNGLLAYRLAWAGSDINSWTAGTIDSRGIIRSTNQDLLHYRYTGNASQSTTWPILDTYNYDTYLDDVYVNKSGDTMTGNLVVQKSNGKISVNNGSTEIGLNNDINRGVWDYSTSRWLITTNGTNSWLNCGNVGIGTNSPSFKLHVNGIIANNNKIISDFAPSAGTYISGVTDAVLNCTSSSSYVPIFNAPTANGRISLASWIGGGDRICLIYCPQSYIDDNTNSYAHSIYWNASTGCLGVDVTNPSQAVHVLGNILATGAVTALSDIRQKSQISNVNTRIEDISNLPLFYFKWKYRDGDDMHIGTSAQAVQKIFPELVLGSEELSVDYGVLGTTIGILLCKRILELGQKVKDLEERIEEFKN